MVGVFGVPVQAEAAAQANLIWGLVNSVIDVVVPHRLPAPSAPILREPFVVDEAIVLTLP